MFLESTLDIIELQHFCKISSHAPLKGAMCGKKLTLSISAMSKSIGYSGLPVYLMHWFQKKNSKKTTDLKSEQTIFDFVPITETEVDSNEPKMKKKSTEKGLQAINNLLLSVVGSPRSSLETKKTPITEDYQISHNVLGLGINGKVVEVKNKKDGQKYALKVSVF